ncbi:tRNA preQ1(34) S-adenosylmethionine ribosyltransferase-isomerase QueA [Paralimibaculum aggregatum]|uniref:S-adenosylmethionine:tRNA ribosyltransferase-isomerase n=1 Tax=Paralimibaculum aggregatum TaxID=3036245 RepID=A0ABQ6LQY2_9RHOB|nr:tRNA preQ1(34) S-adenosylmethionine ribosyltransferase-isomerase QueA [Limibaculum sp. NKW23]GMG83331.1 tRNA preQ1(34) S-adenosylmethionine ribosyltransferase-isomerase QueA [Limibaculum sp. NKW23]
MAAPESPDAPPAGGASSASPVSTGTGTDLDAFDFTLPEELIALRPVRPRPASRLLLAEGAGPGGRPPRDLHVHDLPALLAPGDMLVFNDTRVIPAQLAGIRHRAGAAPGEGTARIEATLIRRLRADAWAALARPAKRLAPGDRIAFGSLAATVEARAGAEAVLVFDRAGAELDAAIAAEGAMPLPPYIARRRPADAQDREDYQPVLARREGAVAAPTASLHFDEPLLAALDAAGIGRAVLTLHVGPGTFLPVTASRIEEHRMHAEWGEITPDTAAAINAARAAGGRVIAVGTTVLRLLESAADARGRIRPFIGETDIFLHPGVTIRSVDGLMTNFHLPRSTLFMLTAALMGTERMQAIYAHAIAACYRFYSYGDSSLLLPGLPPGRVAKTSP